MATEDLIKRLGKLQSTLLTSGLQKENQPLYQVISQLIKAIIESNIGVIGAIAEGGGGGEQGEQGPPGTNGTDGTDGDDGTSISVFQQEPEPMSAIPGDIWMVDDGAPLPDWPVGPAGPMGPAGPTGPATTDASLLTSGILPNARLDSNIPFRNVAEAISGVWDFSNGIKERGRSFKMGEWQTVPYDAANFTGLTAMTWIVDAADQSTYDWTITAGNTMIVAFAILNTTVGGTPSTVLFLKIPDGRVAAKTIHGLCRVVNNGAVQEIAPVAVGAGGTTINFSLMTVGTNWAASTNLTSVRGTIEFEIQP